MSAVMDSMSRQRAATGLALIVRPTGFFGRQPVRAQ
jgi:hypothetical protein